MVDLSTDYLGFELRTPLVASAGPIAEEVDGVRALARAGASAVVLPSLFEEQLVHDAEQIDRMFGATTDFFAEALSFHPDLPDYHTGPDDYLELVRDAAQAVDVPVIGSLNGTTTGGWLRYAERIAEAGARALELNVYLVAADFDATGAEVEQRYVELVSAVRGAVDLPLAVKIGPYFSSLPSMARRLVEAGADALVLFNRFYQPDIDLDALEIAPRLVLSSSQELRLPLRWIAILCGRVHASLAATSGVHTPEDVVKAVLAGADVAMTTSALLRGGPAHLRHLEEGLRTWMAEREYDSVRQMRGSLSQLHVADPEAFERANYLQTLTSWAPLRDS